MPEILLGILIAISSIIGITSLVSYFVEGTPKSIPMVFIPLTILGIAWFIYSSHLPLEYIKIVDATISHNKYAGRTKCYITYETLNNSIITDEIDYISPVAKVRVHLPKKMYFGILYTEPKQCKPIIEVIENNIEVQPSRSEGKAIGLLE